MFQPPPVLAGLLAGFSYRPRWVFEFGHVQGTGRPGDWILAIAGWAENSDHPGHWMVIRDWFPVPPWIAAARYEEVCQDWLHDRVREFEQHESDEWFRVRGARPYDPHAPGQPRSTGLLRA